MIDWDDLRHFLAVHRHGSLAKAATALKMNPTTVGRRLTALEERMGARLFERTPAGFFATPAGHELLPHAERIEGEVLAVERELVGADRRLTGTVRVTATEMIATRFIAPELDSFRSTYPEITIDLVCTSRSLDLGRREADIALRLARPSQSDLVIRKLSHVRLALYASRGYLEARGTPSAPDTTLDGHDVLLFADTRAFSIENEWMERRLDGAAVALRSDSVSSIYSAVLGGVGIALLPQVVAEREPELVRVHTRDEPEPRVIWQMVHPDLKRTPRIRAVLDFLAIALEPPREDVASSD
jgi:DNA-binding transcriptional LysR family regulator